MSKTGFEYLRFYSRIGGRINKKGNFVPFSHAERNKFISNKAHSLICNPSIKAKNKSIPNHTVHGGVYERKNGRANK